MTAPISLADEAAITWYYLFGESRFVRSVHGAMVDRLERDSAGSSRCNCCRGTGILEDAKALGKHQCRGKSLERRTVWRMTETAPDGCDRQRGRGVATDEQVVEWVPVALGSCCQYCNGTGWRAAKRLKPRCECWGTGKLARQHCPVCLGTGTPTVDARPVHQEATEGGVEVDGDTLTRFAVVARRLSRMRATDRRTLERYYGAHGFSWAGQPGGRMLGLLEFTQAGRHLLRRTRVKGDEATEASPAERLAAQQALEASSPVEWRRDLLALAAQEATAALRTAHEAWQATRGRQSLARELDALLGRICATGQALEELYERTDATEIAEEAGR